MRNITILFTRVILLLLFYSRFNFLLISAGAPSLRNLLSYSFEKLSSPNRTGSVWLLVSGKIERDQRIN